MVRTISQNIQACQRCLLKCIYEGKRESAGNGNRTRMASLEGWNFTIKLCPRGIKLPRCATNANSHFSKVGGNRPPTRNTGFLFLECGRDQRGVVAAKTERVT